MGAQICTLHGIGPAKGPARTMAEFITSAIADTSDFDRPDTAPGLACFKCRKRDNHRGAAGMTDDDAVMWQCRLVREVNLESARKPRGIATITENRRNLPN